MSWWQTAVGWFIARDLTTRDDRLYSALGEAPAYSDESVTATSVLGLATASACGRIIASTLSTLSLDVNKKVKGIKVPAPEHPLQFLLDEPNADQTAVDFWEFMSLSLEFWGNAYAEIDRRSDKSIISLTPIRPDFVQVERMDSGALRYRWYDKREIVRSEDDVFHVRGFGGHPLGGMSPLSYAKNTFATAQSIERAAGATFANGIRTNIAITTDKPLNAEQFDTLDKRVSEKYAGAMNAGKPLVLNDLKVVPISINPEDAQMLESRGFNVAEICRIFGVPPVMVGHTEKSTTWGTGIESQLLWFQKTTLRSRAKKIEHAIRRQLMSAEDRRAGFQVNFNFEDFLRADSVSRSNFYEKMLRAGVFTINEVRALEGRGPVEGGDVPRMQSQNIPITEADGLDTQKPQETEDEQAAAA